jgi:hypothetical protein
MATEFATIEVWVMIDEGGDYVADASEENLGQRYADDIGGDEGVARRKVKITLKVPLPKPIELTGEVPEEELTGSELKVA